MHLVIEPSDFARLSSEARDEILRMLQGAGGRRAANRTAAATDGFTPRPAKQGFRWRAPHELDAGLVMRLVEKA